MPRRVMVSSVVNGFEDYREAARQAILAAGDEPILVNEDFPALAASPRTASLDAVASSDILAVVIGARGGFRTPSGKLVVEEEYEEAVRKKLPVIVFIQDVERDDDATRFAQRLSAYVDGRLRCTFTTPDELQSELCDALEASKSDGGETMSRGVSTDVLCASPEVRDVPLLRVLVQPERDEEVIDPVKLESDEFRREVFEIGHSAAVQLFLYEHQKQADVKADTLEIRELASDHHYSVVQLEARITESGTIIVEAFMRSSTRESDATSLLSTFVIAEEDIEARITQAFRFVGALYDRIDQFRRHSSFRMNVALLNLGSRTIERNPRPRASYSMPCRTHDGPIVAFETDRRVSRDDLRGPEEEVRRVVAKIKRAVRERSLT